MASENASDEIGVEVEERASLRQPAGFAAGLVLGVILGAAFALLFAPEPGQKTRRTLSKRLRSMGEKELHRRRKRRLRGELERVRERVREALD
jgi:gas vesicle protein